MTEEEREAAAQEFEIAKAALTPEKLNEELAVIKSFCIGVLRGMKEAHGVGMRFEPDGTEGPFLGDVLSLDGRIKLVDTEPLGEYDEGEDQRFTAEPLVYSPVGEYIRSWWNGMAVMLGMADWSKEHGGYVFGNRKCTDQRFQDVLDGYGTLNFLLFKWEPERLDGDQVRSGHRS